MWNWQQKNWPNFEFDAAAFQHYEQEFLLNAGKLFGSLLHVEEKELEQLKIDLLSNEAYKTSQIEGEILNRESLQSSIKRQFGLKSEMNKSTPAENGMAELMVDVYQSFDKPLTHEQLFEWHKMLCNGRRDLIDVGNYRTHNEPMQVVSGRLDRNIVHFEAPPSKKVAQEMDKFINWFNESDSKYSKTSPLLRSGIIHIYFESIHPFEDGNGRIGRAISEKALSQSLGKPTLIALSQIIEQERKNYYRKLQVNSLDLEINGWLEFFSQTVLKAQEYTQRSIDFLIKKAKFYHRYSKKLNERQKKVVDRIFKEGFEGFKGGLSAENYISITKTSASSATRDLQKLIDIGAFYKEGNLKGTRYYLNL
ncbi:MAG: Fic family protein [Bacteroidia bacterium]